MAWHDMQKQLAKNRRPEDVLAARARGVPLCCPWCGWDPLCATKNKFGSFVVGCENEDCSVQPQVSDPDQSRAWALWNARTPLRPDQSQSLAGE